jgi:hypothetical protein
MTITELKTENAKLREALAAAIPWIGQPAESPAWATSEAKARNRENADWAFQLATNCFEEEGPIEDCIG